MQRRLQRQESASVMKQTTPQKIQSINRLRTQQYQNHFFAAETEGYM